jgi:hypothetical protein
MAAIPLKAPSLPGTRECSPFLNRFVTHQPVNFIRKFHPSLDEASFSRRGRTTVVRVLETEKSTKIEKPEPPVKLIALVGKGEVSPLKSTSWEEVMLHTVSNCLLSRLTIVANS